MVMFHTESNKRRPDHPRPRTGYGGHPNSVFRSPTPCKDTLRETTDGARLGNKTSLDRRPPTLIWWQPLRDTQRVDVRSIQLWQLHIKRLGGRTSSVYARAAQTIICLIIAVEDILRTRKPWVTPRIPHTRHLGHVRDCGKLALVRLDWIDWVLMCLRRLNI